MFQVRSPVDVMGQRFLYPLLPVSPIPIHSGTSRKKVARASGWQLRDFIMIPQAMMNRPPSPL